MSTETKTRLEDKITQFHLNRGNCRCPELEPLWKQMKKIDELASECSNYGDSYTEYPIMKDNETFMNNFKKKVQTWIDKLKNYSEIFADLCMDGSVNIEFYKESKDGKEPLSFERVYYRSLIVPESTRDLNYKFSCDNCGTEIPQINYPDWEIKYFE